MTFQCPNCHSTLDQNSVGFIDLHNGQLECPQCMIITPIINGMYYFTEQEIQYSENHSEVTNTLYDQIASKRKDYLGFISQKISKQMVDAYSAFQPFNESSRAFYPFIDMIRSVLQPGDVILDTWCRTGWTSYFLSGLFPDQEIISVWEGNKDVLGYQGFDYWLSTERKPKNVHVIFHDMNKRLPIGDDKIKLVYGLDTLHRYDQTVLIPEVLRVTHEDGLIIFPHIHLTNSMPDPFFDRGEKQLHGLDYERYFDRLLKNTNRKAFVVSEPEMFSLENQSNLKSDPKTSDYNALIGIMPSAIKPKLKPYQFELEDPARSFVLVNPYLKIDFTKSRIELNKDYLNGVVGKMLDRHPIYKQKIDQAIDYSLSNTEAKIIYLAGHGYRLLEIAERLKISSNEIINLLKGLSSKEIVHVLPLDPSAVNLQNFHGAGRLYPATGKQTLCHLGALSKQKFSTQPVLINVNDGSELMQEDCDYLIGQVQALLTTNIKAEDRIVISSTPHFEAILTYWAAVQMGVEIFIIGSTEPGAIKKELIKDVEPKYIFADSNVFRELGLSDQWEIVVFDQEEIDVPTEYTFSVWLDKDIDKEDYEYTLDPNSAAVTLFSSGTTGKPKGIRLSHAALYNSGKLMAETYNWTNSDRLLMISEMDSMSGLRNTCIATQFSGTTLIIPDFTKGPSVFAIVEAVEKHQVTIITSTPALIKQLVKLGSRIKNSLKSIQQVICTGGYLSENLVKEFREIFEIEVLNYYGLTETTGLCIGETPDKAHESVGSIGEATDSIVQIVDDKNAILPPNTTGRLRVFNDRLMIEYLNGVKAQGVSIQNGWLYTGDLAYVDQNGYFHLQGRERDIIKDIAGNVVYLSEIENCLNQHQKVKEVAVCGVTKEGTEFMVAFVISAAEEQNEESLAKELKAYVHEQLGRNKIPDQMIFTDQFNSTRRGKVDKKALIKSFEKTANEYF